MVITLGPLLESESDQHGTKLFKTDTGVAPAGKDPE
jgi:hypothetical protein